jgi:carbonic anhydrase
LAGSVKELDGDGEDGEDEDDEAHEGKKGKGEEKKKAKAKAKAHTTDEAENSEESAEPAAAHAAPEHWGYEGEHGPAVWGGTCSAGAEQSPIDIMPKRSSAPEVFFVYRPTRGVVVDNGHTLQVDLDPGSYIVVDGGRFDLIQFHVHTPSEHTIAGDHFPLELHLVHRDRTGTLAVVGVLFDEGEPATAMKPVWTRAPRKAGKASLEKPFDPEALLPHERMAYRYDGSLTTPPCSEGVRWIVLKRTRTEDGERIAALRARFGANARPVQELGEREVR